MVLSSFVGFTVVNVSQSHCVDTASIAVPVEVRSDHLFITIDFSIGSRALQFCGSIPLNVVEKH